MADMFKPYQGGIQPIQGISEAGYRIGQTAGSGLAEFGKNLAEGIKEYSKKQQLDQVATAELDAVAMSLKAYKDDPEYGPMALGIAEDVIANRDKNTATKLAVAKSAQLQLQQMPSVAQLRIEEKKTAEALAANVANLASLTSTLAQNPKYAPFVAENVKLLQRAQNASTRTERMNANAEVSGVLQNFSARFGIYKENLADTEAAAALQARQGNIPTTTQTPTAVMYTGAALDPNKSVHENKLMYLDAQKKAIATGKMQPVSEAEFDRQFYDAIGAAAEKSSPEVASVLAFQTHISRARDVQAKIAKWVPESVSNLASNFSANFRVMKDVSKSIVNILDTPSIQETRNLVYESKLADAIKDMPEADRKTLVSYKDMALKLKALSAGATVEINGTKISGYGGEFRGSEEWFAEKGIPTRTQLEAQNRKIQDLREQASTPSENQGGILLRISTEEQKYKDMLSQREKAIVPVRYSIDPYSVMAFDEFKGMHDELIQSGKTEEQAMSIISGITQKRVAVLRAIPIVDNLKAAYLANDDKRILAEAERLAEINDPDVTRNVLEFGFGVGATYLTGKGAKALLTKAGIIEAVTEAVKNSEPVPQAAPAARPASAGRNRGNAFPSQTPKAGPSPVGPIRTPWRQRNRGPAPARTPSAGPSQVGPAETQAPASTPTEAPAKTTPTKGGFKEGVKSVGRGIGKVFGGLLQAGSGAISYSDIFGTTGQMIGDAISGEINSKKGQQLQGAIGTVAAGFGLGMGAAQASGWGVAARVNPIILQATLVKEATFSIPLIAAKLMSYPMSYYYDMTPEETYSRVYSSDGAAGNIGFTDVLTPYSTTAGWVSSLNAKPLSQLERNEKELRVIASANLRKEAETAAVQALTKGAEVESRYGIPVREKPLGAITIGDIKMGTAIRTRERPEADIKEDFTKYITARLGYTPNNIDELYDRTFNGDKPKVVEANGRSFLATRNANGTQTFTPLAEKSQTKEALTFKQQLEVQGNTFKNLTLSADDSRPDSNRVVLNGFFNGTTEARGKFTDEVISTTQGNEAMRRLIGYAKDVSSRVSLTDRKVAEAEVAMLIGEFRSLLVGGSGISNWEQQEVLRKVISNPTDVLSWSPAEIQKYEMMIQRSEQAVINKGKVYGVSVVFNPERELDRKIQEARTRNPR